MMNSSTNQPKFSKIEKATNNYIILGILIQSAACILAAVLQSMWDYYVVEELK